MSMNASTSSLLATPLLLDIKSKTHQLIIKQKTSAISSYTSKMYRNSQLIASCLKNKVIADHDHISYAADKQYYQLEKAVKKIKKTMLSYLRKDDFVQELVMIDGIQRLGLDHYFRDDIHAALEKHYVHFTTMAEGDDNLHDVALRFRLLRQQGFNVSADTFNKFKDKEGKFRPELKQDTKGLLSLFEASHLSIPNEDILDEAGDFSLKLLKTTLNTVENVEAMMIRNTINNPYYKSLPRLTAKAQLQNFETLLRFMHDCFGTQQWIMEVQDLARIDIIMCQLNLRVELAHISRWWKGICISEITYYARNQPLKWHMWSWIALPSPAKAELRIDFTKSISFVYIIDDIFDDANGKIEELTLFTEAVNRWEYANINGLPDYMKTCLRALYDTTNDLSQKIYIKHGCHSMDLLQKAWAELCNAFLVEARWFRSNYLPTPKEYLKNGIVSSGVQVVFATLFSLMGEEVDENRNINICTNQPDIVTLAGTILRLWDDLGSAKDENQDGFDGSFLACYLNEHQGTSDKTAKELVAKMISEAWKGLNVECLSHLQFSADFRIAFLNSARMIPIMYNYDENHCLPVLEKHMKTMLCDE